MSPEAANMFKQFEFADRRRAAEADAEADFTRQGLGLNYRIEYLETVV